MKYLLLMLMLLPGGTMVSMAQPFALSTNNLNGSPYDCRLLDDLGVYKRLRVQALQNATAPTWEFPEQCTFPGNVWRPYSAGSAPVGFNVTIPPQPGTNAALYNSNNGGASGTIAPVTAGNYYTFNVQNIAIPNSPYFAVLETTYLPVDLNTAVVTQSPAANIVAANSTVTINITTSSPPNAAEHIYIRYTTDDFVTTTLTEAVFNASQGTATIPAFPIGTNVKYYVYSSSKTQTAIDAEVALYGQVVHDMSTLEWNTNNAQNYSYTVTGVLPLNRFGYFTAVGLDAGNQLNWKLNCTTVENLFITIEESTDARNFKDVYSIEADGVRCRQPFQYLADNHNDQVIYYRLRVKDMDGRISYSTVAIVKRTGSTFTLLKMVPSLVEGGHSILQVLSAVQTRAQVQITDVSGKIVQQWTVILAEGPNNIPVQLVALPAGSFIVKVQVKSTAATTRFTKIK